MKYLIAGLLCVGIPIVCASGANSHTVKSASVGSLTQVQEEKHTDFIEISPQGQKAAGISTQILKKSMLPIYVHAPGEAIPNADLTAIVTPRIKAQVVDRLVKVGDTVKKGQPLVRLSSVAMAKAQANLLLTKKEWWRLEQLGMKVVSAKRLQTSEVAYLQAFSILQAYGMTRAQINAFAKLNDPRKANGEFTLLARRKGTIFSANFSEGQMIEPGKVLYRIVDESNLWVDAKLSNGDFVKIKKGTRAIVKTDHYELPATVLQVHHQLDAVTRTRVARLSVPNPKDQLHPGEFVTCLIQAGKTKPALAVRDTTLMRTADGDVAVYVEVKPDHFMAKEVQVIRKIGDWRIIKGLKVGMRIVTNGAFFVHSQATKAGFSSHNH